jgi:DNA repair exonuclease SbcCD nuclease subunit
MKLYINRILNGKIFDISPLHEFMKFGSIKTKNSSITKNSIIPLLRKSGMMILNSGGEIVNFQWQIGTSTFTGTTKEFTFNENGEYQVTLTVTDNDGATSSTSTTIKVEPFSFATITDLHIGRGYPDYDGKGYDDGYNGEEYYLTQRLRNVVKWINENKEKYSFKFVAVLGDIADSAEKSEFLKAKEILNELNDPNGDGDLSDGIPYVPVFGNHDVWPKTDLGHRAESPLGVNYFEEIFFNENATNTRLLKEKLNLTKEDFQYKNYLFKFSGINFIVLDFITRKDVGKATLYEQTMDWLKEKLNEFQGKEPIILFSHHPLTPERSREFYGRQIIPFPGTNFDPRQIEKLTEILQEYESLTEGKQVLGAFGGHVHGYYPQEILDFELPHLQWFFDANYEYPSIGPTSAVTTEALMVGSNRENEYLKENKKGIIRIAKVLDKEKVDYQTIEGRYNPDPEKGKEFIALNPYLSFEYKILSERIYPCVFFRAHLFTKRDASVIWDFGDGKTGALDVIVHCYDKPGVYEVKLSAIDNKTLVEESITRKIEIKKEGIIPKIIKISEKMKDKVELISTELGEKVTEFGRTMQDWIIAKVKHSPSTPVGLFKVHFEKAKEDIDLNELRIDVDLERRKSLLYMPQWPGEIEKEKVLFVPK